MGRGSNLEKRSSAAHTSLELGYGMRQSPTRLNPSRLAQDFQSSHAPYASSSGFKYPAASSHSLADNSWPTYP